MVRFFQFFDSLNKLENEFKWYEKMFATAEYRKLECEKSVQKALENDSGVKLLLKAMNDLGWYIHNELKKKTTYWPGMSLLRNFSCEECDQAVRGGYDSLTNQVVLCHNRIYNYDDCSEILAHELIHAFDFCRARIDVSNNSHVACTEIRAANLSGCSLPQTLREGIGRNKQKQCVKNKAASSLHIIKSSSGMDLFEAMRIVDTVFDKCYNDLEPFGRRIIDTKNDYDRAFEDNKCFDHSKFYKTH